MTDILYLLFKGLSLGSLYALSAMGFVLIFKTGRVINLAHGQLMAMGAFIFLLLSSFSGITFIAVFLLSVIIGLVMVLIIERLLIRPLFPMNMKQGIFITVGIMLMLKGLISFVSLSPAEDISTGPGISSVHVLILAAGIASVLLFLLFFRRSSLGLYIRAVSDNRKAALSLGFPIERLYAFSCIIAGMAALISGILMAAGSGLNAPELGSMESVIFPAIILGGLGSMRGAILGGILIGVLETCAGGRVSGPLGDLFPYLMLVIILLARPNGLFSDKIDLAGIKE
jgi:branched-chain amino acid transport system permease protein